jgi:hypothetical protein
VRKFGSWNAGRRGLRRGAGTLILSAALAPTGFASSLGAQVVPIGGEIAIRPPGPSEEYLEVSSDRLGGWGVAWDYRDPDDGREGEGRMRLFDRNGDFVSGTLRDFEWRYPTIGLDGAGNSVVIGLKWHPELGGYELGASCVDYAGRPRGAAVRVDTGNISPGTRVPYLPDVAVDTDGTFVAAWQENPQVAGVEASVFFRRFDAECRALGDVQSLGSVGTVGRRTPKVARRQGGGFALVWLEGPGSGFPRLVAQLFDRQGNALAPEFVVADNSRSIDLVDVIAAPSGDLAVSWRSGHQGSSGASLLARVFSDVGSPVGSQLTLRDSAAEWFFDLRLAIVSGSFFAVWRESGLHPSTTSIHGRAFRSTAPLGDTLLIRPSGSGPDLRDVSVAGLTGAEFVVTWSTTYFESTPTRLVAQRYAILQPAPACVESSTALCLGGSRFRVTVEWRDFQGSRGYGHTRSLTDDSGLFWFFDDANLELLVKVVDGCAEFSRHWFFAAATTNVEYTLRVTDTYTGRSRSYFNRPGVSSPAITDTDAFSTCP